jgi:hypothetical protein
MYKLIRIYLKGSDRATFLIFAIDLFLQDSLAEHQGRLSEFAQRFEKIKSDYQNRPALIAKFKTIKV